MRGEDKRYLFLKNKNDSRDRGQKESPSWALSVRIRGGELIYPQSPGGHERTSACGDSGGVFNASLLGGMGVQLLSGSGHIQYRGITPGSSREMKNSLSLGKTASLNGGKEGTPQHARLTALTCGECEDGGALSASLCCTGIPGAHERIGKVDP